MGAAIKLNLVQGSVEWLNARYEYLTASQAPVLFDLCPYQTRLGLFEEKVLREEVKSNEDKEFIFAKGHAAEKTMRDWLDRAGLKYEPAVLVSNEHPFLLASLDGITPSGTRILECKYVGAARLEAIRKGTVPPNHLCQVQTALLVSGAEVCDYFASDPSGEAHVLEIFPDKAYQAEVVEAARKFMECVRTGEPPEPGERDWHTPAPEERTKFEELERVNAELSLLQDTFDSLKAELVGNYADKKRVTWGAVQIIRSIKKGTIDYKKVPQLKGLDLEKYRRPSSEVASVRFKKEQS